MALAIILHVISAVIWVGGMFFAILFLRPAAGGLEPPVRLRLWRDVLTRFMPAVLFEALLLLGTGLWLMFARFDGFSAPLHIHVMLALGLVMMAMALHVRFAPLKRLQRAVDAADWETGARALDQIRRFVTANLVLGLVVVAVASGGRYGLLS